MSEPTRRTGALAPFIASAPLQSAAAVLVVLALTGAAIVFAVVDSKLIGRVFADPLELIGAGLTSIAAMIAAFRIHVRGRTLPWRVLPLVIFALWQMLSIYRCNDVPTQSILYSHSPNCLLFILATSIPIGLFLFAVLRLHRTSLGWSASAMTGLAISAATIVLLRFFHDFAMDPGDWSIHLLAMGIVVGSSAYVGQVMPGREIER